MGKCVIIIGTMEPKVVVSILFCTILTGICHTTWSSTPSKVTPLWVAEQLLWKDYEADIREYRIPILTTTPKGTLIVAAEARKASTSDVGAKYLAVRRSTDRGKTWLPTMYLLKELDITDGMNLGTITVDWEKNFIFIIYQMCAHYDDCDTATAHLLKSQDDGLSWSKPMNLSAQPGVGTQQFSPGPGYGIQKKLEPHKGRLITCGHSTLNEAGVYCLTSDDHGDTWKHSATSYGFPYGQKKISGDYQPDENQIIELSNGDLMINARNQKKMHCACRIIMRSTDGGDSIDPKSIYFDETLVDPAVCGSVYNHNGVLFFSNPNNAEHRDGLTLRWSYDEGKTWSGSLPIWAEYTAYSSMGGFDINAFGVDAASRVYIVYEKGATNIDGISFATFSLYGDL